MTERNLGAALDVLFEGAAVVSTPRAFKALDVGVTKGHELLNSGVLKSVKIGRSRRVYVDSIKEVLANGVPLTPKAKPPIKRPT